MRLSDAEAAKIMAQLNANPAYLAAVADLEAQDAAGTPVESMTVQEFIARARARKNNP